MLYNLANDSRIPKLGLDLKLDDGKLVSIPYIHTDGRTDKKTDRATQNMGPVDFENHAKADKFYNFCLIATKSAL